MASLLAGVSRVLFAHAHPDDETLATGALIAHLRRQGTDVVVLTATRGEAGEVVPGVLTEVSTSADLAAARERELAEALAVLGVTEHYYLGAPPARAAGLEARRYQDSGMRWVTETMAGPADVSNQQSLTAATLAEVTSDLVAVLDHVRPDLLISYDDTGGYGHPDHVRMCRASAAAAGQSGVPMAELVSEEPERSGTTEWLQLTDELPTVIAALNRHRSQLTVHGRDVVHVGGQREPILMTAGLRLI